MVFAQILACIGLLTVAGVAGFFFGKLEEKYLKDRIRREIERRKV